MFKYDTTLYAVSEFKRNFIKGPEDVVTTYDVPYDYSSLMHYPNTAFSKNGKNTIIAKVNSAIHKYQLCGKRRFQLV